MPRASNIASELEFGRLQAIKGDAPCAEIFSAGASSQNGGRGSTQYGVSLLKCKWEPPSAGVRGDESLAKNFNFASFADATRLRGLHHRTPRLRRTRFSVRTVKEKDNH